jgi:hypothetical protein
VLRLVSINKRTLPRRGEYFYGVVSLSSVVGVCLDFPRINPVRALFLTAVINGLLDPSTQTRSSSERWPTTLERHFAR